MRPTRFWPIAAILAALLTAGPSLTPPAHAQALAFNPETTEPVSGVITADDTDVAILIRYVGSTGTAATQSGDVEVAAGDILLKTGAIGAEIADVTITRCGATDGTLDADDAECNTLGEMVDSINVSANWVAVILDGLRSDVISGAQLLTRARIDANLVAGIPLFWDTSVAFTSTIALVPSEARTMGFYYNRSPPNNALTSSDPWSQTRTGYCLGNATSTYASGTSTLQVISTKVTNSGTGNGAEVNTTLYSEAGGATTVSKTFDYRDICLWGKKGEKLIVRLDNSAAMSVVTNRQFGYQVRYRSSP
jgi:hypothetical protein